MGEDTLQIWQVLADRW